VYRRGEGHDGSDVAPLPARLRFSAEQLSNSQSAGGAEGDPGGPKITNANGVAIMTSRQSITQKRAVIYIATTATTFEKVRRGITPRPAPLTY